MWNTALRFFPSTNSILRHELSSFPTAVPRCSRREPSSWGGKRPLLPGGNAGVTGALRGGGRCAVPGQMPLGAGRAENSPVRMGTATLTTVVKTRKPTPKMPAATCHSVSVGVYS